MSYTEEGCLYISKSLFNDLETVGSIKDTDSEQRNSAIEMIAETFKMTLAQKYSDELYHRGATLVWRSLETFHITHYVNEEHRDSIIEFIEFVIKTKAEASKRAEALYERCKLLQLEKDESASNENSTRHEKSA